MTHVASVSVLALVAALAFTAPAPAQSKAEATETKVVKLAAKSAKPEAKKSKDQAKAKASKPGKVEANSSKSAKTAAKPSKPVKPSKTEAKAVKPSKPEPKAAAHSKASKAPTQVPIPRSRPSAVAKNSERAPIQALAAGAPAAPLAGSAKALPPAFVTASAGDFSFGAPSSTERPSDPTAKPLSYAPTAAPTFSDIEAVKEAIALVRKGRTSEATDKAQNIRDAAGQKLVEWMILRSDDVNASFARYAAFVRNNPAWPSVGMIRRRAEGQLWQQKLDAGTVFAFFSTSKPTSTLGRLAMARAALTQGDRATAQKFVREAWRQDSMSDDLENQVIELFGELLTRADHKARMDIRLYAEDSDDGLRAAQRLGGNEVAIAKARIAVARKASNAGALLDSVPSEARSDPGYVLARAQWLRRNERITEAAQALLSAPNDAAVIHDTNEWWIERRLVARKLLDANNPQTAYRLAAGAAAPTNENRRIEHQFTAGWIALRFLNDPTTAYRHFAQIPQGVSNPISLARGEYWQARAAEEAGKTDQARAHYEAAGRFPTAYYGQLARARLDRQDLAVRRAPELSESQRISMRNLDVVRAVEILYAAGERDLVVPFVTDLAERTSEVGCLAVLAEIAARHNDARATLIIGKTALGRGFAFDAHAFPNIGIPQYSAVGPSIDRSVVYAIARQESAFNPKAVSSASALGLMQVMPGTGRQLAKKFGVAWNQQRMLTDPAYNAQLGSAELGDLARDYDGNYVLAFAAYNAGRGRVREWIERYGDPRKPDVDPIDWVERIPFSETRNYVQRVMENTQVYRARLGSGTRLMIEADLRGTRAQ
jgi:soluble lytic murein transglycosylase